MVFRSPESSIESGRMDIERIYRKIEPKLEESAINPEDFRDHYGEETIEKDIKKVQSLEEKFRSKASSEDEHSKKLAKTFEWIMHEGIELNNWLGETANTILPSKYDDYLNRVDTIAEFTSEEGSWAHLAFAIDVTIGMDQVRKKLNSIKQEIDKGELSRVKYFVSGDQSFKGELSKIPRAVLAVSAKSAQELAETWNASKVKGLHREEGEVSPKKVLADHFIQFQIMDELALQLAYFAKYAEKIGNKEIEKTFTSMRERVLKIKGQRIEDGKEDTRERDEGMEFVKSALESVFSL